MANSNKEKYYSANESGRSTHTLLDELDALLGRLEGYNPELAKSILACFGDLTLAYQSMQLDSQESHSIQTQYEYMEKRIHGLSFQIVKAAGGPEKYKALRLEDKHSPADAWWWNLDELNRQKNARSLKRSAIISGIVIGVISVLAIVYQVFLAPPPEVRARLQHENQASVYIETKDYAGALNEVEQALSYDPQNYSLLIQKGVLELVLGDKESANSSFDTATSVDPDKERYYLERAYNEVILGMNEEMMADAQALLAINPQSPEAYMLIGQSYEQQGDINAALEEYGKASELAEEQQKTELIATVRMRMAMLMQMAEMPTMEP
ncbi:MAG: hypothetical protein CVU39_23435 [Chloroflexi bacterium HGW-Chloroflexi-10]|nr:MAG: hypothetical protein CVU39_23435 [Chloroflexi bacterium HGW-Chloroflexi-10]